MEAVIAPIIANTLTVTHFQHDFLVEYRRCFYDVSKEYANFLFVSTSVFFIAIILSSDIAASQADADAAKSAAALAAAQAATPLKLAAAVSVAQPAVSASASSSSSSSSSSSLLSVRTAAAASGGCHLRTLAYHDATGATPFAEARRFIWQAINMNGGQSYEWRAII